MKKELSALIDGEFDIEDSEHIMTAIKANKETKEAWKHYHLIGDAMRGDVSLEPNFSEKVMSALDAEPTVLAVNKQAADQQTTTKRYIKTPMFWSVAASAAAVMFVGMMVFELQLGESADMTPVEIAKSLPIEYLQAHQSVAPSGSSYYIQSVGYTESQQ